MRVKDWREEFKKIPGAAYLINEPMSRHTSFRVGGPAELMAIPRSEEGLKALLKSSYERGLPVVILGGGTNVLVLDGGIRGLVLKLGQGFMDVGERAGGLCAGAALPLSRLLAEARKRNMSGLEFAAGIPGSVGGGLWVNAGAYGEWLGSRFLSAKGVSYQGESVSVTAAAVKFEYRSASFVMPMALTEATFALEPGDPDRMDEVMRAALDRRAGQPLDVPSAGCVFKNPAGDAAARLIDGAKLKGVQVGGAKVSERHANFIVNVEGARASDVLRLIAEVKKRVMEQFGVSLEMEVRVLGEAA
jgi:UDP-N-acetylmuramate dehydrogenase